VIDPAPLPHAVYIVFLFALGACVGSFLNVVVWRLPRVELPDDVGLFGEFWLTFKALSDPPSHCPKCQNRLKWYDNLPVVGWIKLRGRCRFCREPISPRYPIVEAVTGLLFVGYYVAYFMLQVRSCCPVPHLTVIASPFPGLNVTVGHSAWVWADAWPIYLLYMALISGLLAASLIDAELYIIPVQIPWILAVVGIVVHMIADGPAIPGSLMLVPGSTGRLETAAAAGGGVGFLVSLILWSRGWLPTSFPTGEPMLEVDRVNLLAEIARAKKSGEPIPDEPVPPSYTRRQIRVEISKEMGFLLPPLIGAAIALALVQFVSPVWADVLLHQRPIAAGLGAVLGALIGAFVVWIIRILGTIGFGRVAMGLGDVHLMFGVGAVIGAGGATVAFFLAPLAGLAFALWFLITRRRREIPLGPFLSLATAVVMLSYCPIAAWLKPGLAGLVQSGPGGFVDLIHAIFG
jgi:leader peptidase (prepilin peptidase)/N-methyltransferase